VSADNTKRGAAALLVILVNALAVLFVYWAVHPVAALTSTIFHLIALVVVLYYLLWRPEDLKGDLYFALLLTGLFTALIDGNILLNRIAYTPRVNTATGAIYVDVLLAVVAFATALASLKRPRLAVVTGFAVMALLASSFVAEIYG